MKEVRGRERCRGVVWCGVVLGKLFKKKKKGSRCRLDL